MAGYVLEACVETIEDALRAAENSADRLELCTDLAQDGLTPGQQLIVEVTRLVSIPVKVMLRPRAGDFVYYADDREILFTELDRLKQLPIAGLVFGALEPNGTLDLSLIQKVAMEADGLPLTVHKAIDLVEDPISTTRQLLEVKGVTSILTSGGQATALAGKNVINKMVDVSNGRLSIIAAGKVTFENLAEVKRVLTAKEFHGRRIVH